MSKKYIAIHDGKTFKRGTASRSYSHMVVGLLNIAANRVKDAKDAAKSYAGDLPYWKQVVAMDPSVRFSDDDAKFAERAARAAAEIAKGVDGHVAEALVRFDARASQAWKSSDGLDFMSDLGWARTPELAAKNASKFHKYGYRTVIVPAVEV